MNLMKSLQKHCKTEIEEDCGVDFTGRIKDKGKSKSKSS